MHRTGQQTSRVVRRKNFVLHFCFFDTARQPQRKGSSFANHLRSSNKGMPHANLIGLARHMGCQDEQEEFQK